MRELLVRLFETWVEKRWLKEIEKATNELRKAKEKVRIKAFVLNALLKEYEEEYGWRE